jgi:hypothetical protein
MIFFRKDMMCVFVNLCEADDRLNNLNFELEIVNSDDLFIE